MSLAQLKSEILSLVDSTNNEDVLSLVREELVENQKADAGYDPADELDQHSLQQLTALAEEDPLADTILLDELKHKVASWRSK